MAQTPLSNLADASPAAGAGYLNVKWQNTAPYTNPSGYSQRDISAEVPITGNGSKVVSASGSATHNGVLLYDATGNAIVSDALTTKGDVLAFDGSALKRLGVGTDGYVLTARASASLGIDWEAASGGGGGGGASTWPPYAHIGDPTVQTWGWWNQSGASIATYGSMITLLGTSSSSGNIQARYCSQPATPYTIYATVRVMLPQASWPHGGVGFLDTVSGKMIVFASIYSSPVLEIYAYTNFSSGTTDLSPARAPYISQDGNEITFVLQNTGTNLNFYYTPDFGNTLVLMRTQAVGAFMTPNSLMFFADSNHANSPVATTLLNWGFTTP